MRAPSLPPLGEAAGGTGATPAGEGTPGIEADPLVGNGLLSPVCRPPLLAGLSEESREDCETSGFAAAAAPTSDYGVDVHIDTGFLSAADTSELDLVQSLIVVPAWSALVWAVHAVFVMLEWGFSLELLGGATATRTAAALLREQAGITAPWLPLALAFASILIAYDGLVRRRVAGSLGDALSMAAMMVVGLWLIGDPAGTIGALTSFSGRTSLGALAIATGERPAAQGMSLGDSLRVLFAGAVEAPWCYLEFGDVSWCGQSADPRLRAAARQIVRDELSEAVCPHPAMGCERPSKAIVRALGQSVRLLRTARTNRQTFLALPANGSARNSINRGDSLLRAMCQSSDASDCRGPTAAQAEFRTASGTWPRVEGLMLIAAGLLGLVMLLVFVAVRLLAAATETLVYLLLAPAVVLAPAFGWAGRSLFTRWLSRLLSAALSKLLFAFLLGLLLTVSAVLLGLQGLGWWTQWLLLSAFWWTAFLKRRQVLEPLGAAPPRPARGRSAGRTVLSGRRLALTAMLDRRYRLAPEIPPPVPETPSPSLASPQAVVASRGQPGATDPQVAAMLGHGGSGSGTERQASAAAAEHEAQLQRITKARGAAVASGDDRRAAVLGHRHDRVESALAAERARATWLGANSLPTREATAACERFLDSQAALPEAHDVRGTSPARDYASLAPLAGYDAPTYEALGSAAQRVARLGIDRQLRTRRGQALPDQADRAEVVDRSPSQVAADIEEAMRALRAVSAPDGMTPGQS